MLAKWWRMFGEEKGGFMEKSYCWLVAKYGEDKWDWEPKKFQSIRGQGRVGKC